GVPLQGHPRGPRYRRRLRPQAGPFQVRREAGQLMPRRAEISVRPVVPDAVYNSTLVTQVINKVMSEGKKSTAEQIVYDALTRIGEKTGKPPVEVLEQEIGRAHV